MAGASKVQLQATQRPEYYTSGIQQEAVDTASTMLQRNHEEHHIFFNRDGFHSHIDHHLLTIWALPAGPRELRRAYDINLGYQRPLVPLDKSVVTDMPDPVKFRSYVGNERYYHDFLVFLQREMEKTSLPDVVNKCGDERADDLFSRLFGGFLHPIIHPGFGLEFQQPAIVAEALDQAAVHGPYMSKFFLPAEKTKERCQRTYQKHRRAA